MAESLPPSGQRKRSAKLGRKRSLEVDETEVTEKSAETRTEERPETPETNPTVMDCAICLQTCVHPARLPCGHVFCFLCIKGIFRTSSKCAMCRTAIPRDYLDKPELVDVPGPSTPSTEGEEAYRWFYEGRHGWWEYDARNNADLETAFLAEENTVELLIAGCLYVIDLQGLMQYRKNDPGKKRAIKRDRVGVASNGVAGLWPASLQAVGSHHGRNWNTSVSPERNMVDRIADIFRSIRPLGEDQLNYLYSARNPRQNSDNSSHDGTNLSHNYALDESSFDDAFSRLHVGQPNHLSAISYSDNEDDDNDDGYD